MPSRPLRCCSYPGCPNLVVSGKCAEHSKQDRQRQDRQRGSFRERGYTSNWDKPGGIRETKLRRDPICQRCESRGTIKPAKLVHHIVSLSKGGSLSDMNNLLSLCVKCHDEIHREQGDKW
jgi:5-methylcytosine-specific restriction protein A